MNKLEKTFEVIGWFVIILTLIMLIGFIFMIVVLSRFDKCKDLDFQLPYCEKYKNF